MDIIGWSVVLAIVAPLVSRRLGWDWKPGAVMLLWAVILMAAGSWAPLLASLFGEPVHVDGQNDRRWIMAVAFVAQAVGVILVFVGVSFFEPLEDSDD